jgi:hypothetical protein
VAPAYHPLARHSTKNWLMTDGRIVEELSLEQSESGRRIRVTGSKESVYAKELDDLVFRSVRQFAEHNGAKVWMRETGGEHGHMPPTGA